MGRSRENIAGADALLERAELEHLLSELVLRLEEPFRQTLLLRYYAGQSAAEIARRLAVPGGTIRWRLKRALDQLRCELDQRHGGRRVEWRRALAPIASSSRLWRGAAGFAAATAAVGLLLTVGLGLHGFLVEQPRALQNHSADRIQGARGPTVPDRRLATMAVHLAGAAERARRPGGVLGLGAIDGRVVDQDAAPVAGATVSLVRQGTAATRTRDVDGKTEIPPSVSRADGAFGFSRLSPGWYNLSVGADGFAAAGRVSIRIEGGGMPPFIQIAVARGGVLLAGRVLDAGGGAIPGATVRVTGGQIHGHRLQTDHEGRFRMQLPRLEAKAYLVVAQADGYATASAQLELREDAVHDFELEPTALVAGRVVSAWDREPVAGAAVFALRLDTVGIRFFQWDQSPRYLSVDDGSFRIADLRPGTYALLARKGSWVGELGPPLLVAAGVGGGVVEIVIDEGLRLEGTVRADGDPVRTAFIRLVPVEEAPAAQVRGSSTTKTDARGRFRMAGLLPGEYQLEASAPK